MKNLKILFVISVLILTRTAFGAIIGYEFDWTPSNGQVQYDTSFLYGGGSVTGGVFKPANLISFSIGSPFGTITPTSKGPGAGFAFDTPYGPSFQVQGTIQPIIYANNPWTPGYQEYFQNNLDILFQGTNETITYYDTKNEPNINLTGTWTEKIINAPDTTSSVLLLAMALGGLGLFHAARRGKVRSSL